MKRRKEEGKEEKRREKEVIHMRKHENSCGFTKSLRSAKLPPDLAGQPKLSTCTSALLSPPTLSCGTPRIFWRFIV